MPWETRVVVTQSKPVEVVAGIIYQGDQILIAKRPLDKHQGGLWEFPGGKVDHAESKENALFRECLEELDIKISDPKFFDQVSFDYGDKQVSITFFLVALFDGVVKGNEGQEVTWVNRMELQNKEFPEANKAIVSQLTKTNFKYK